MSAESLEHQSTQQKASFDSLGILDEWLAFLHDRQGLSGSAIHIADRTGDVYSRCFGMADANSSTQLTDRHLFNVGSQAKLLLAILLMRMAQAKQLDLDSPASEHIDWLKLHKSPRVADASIRNLMAHQTGLARDGFDGDFWQGTFSFPDEQRLRSLVLESPVTPLAVSRKYSNLGYAVLGLIIERITHKSFTELVSAHLLPTQTNLPKAKAYSRKLNDRRTELNLQETGSPYAAVSGIWSNPASMARLLVEVAAPHNGILRPSDWTTMKSGQPPYGCGVEIMRLRNGSLVHGHSGGFRGHRSATFIDGSGVAVSIAANCADAPVIDLCQGIFELLRFKPIEDRRMGIFSNEWSDIHLVRNAATIKSLNPNSWNPFVRSIDEFEELNDLRLRIVESQGDYFTGEYLDFAADYESLRNAGFTFSRHRFT